MEPDVKNGKGRECWGVFISVSASGVGRTSKGIKNLRISRCGLHLFNGIKIGRQTEHERGLSRVT